MSGPAALLARPDFRRLWITGGLTGILRWLEVLGVGLFALNGGASPLVVALLFLARTLPTALLGAPVGALAESADRRRLLVAGLAVLAGNAGVLALLAMSGRLELWHVAVGAAVNGAVWTLEHPVRRTLLSEAAAGADLGAAMSLDSATFNATRLIGPLAGGVLFATLGMPGVYLLGAATYAAAALNLLRLGLQPLPAGPARPAFLRTLAEGIGHVRANPLLAGVMVLTAVVNFFGFSYASMVPVIGGTTLGLSAAGIGVLQGMEGLGAFCGALLLTVTTRPAWYARTFLLAGVLFLCAVIAFSLSQSTALSMTALLAAGPGAAAFGAMQSTVLLSTAGPGLRMRVMGVLVMCIGAGPPGVLVTGLLANRLGPAVAVTLMASTGLALLVLAALRWPALWRRGA